MRNITFKHARVSDQNGAGISAEGRNLTIARCKFIDNENGILANPARGTTTVGPPHGTRTEPFTEAPVMR